MQLYRQFEIKCHVLNMAELRISNLLQRLTKIYEVAPEV